MADSSAQDTVLVVDDREENRYILSRVLRKNGFAVCEAADGRSALVCALQNPSVILLDINLPDVSGYEVCRRLKANPATNAIPVLHLSAQFTSTESRVQSLQGGADAYLIQPVDPLVLVATIQALLRLRRAETISRLSARQWQSTFDALAEGVALLDREGRVLRCNRAMTGIVRHSYTQIEGGDGAALLRELGYVEEGFDPAVGRIVRECHVDERWMRISIDPITTETGERAGRIVVIADITERKLKDEALRASERLAETGRLAHAIAHEINNPLEALTNLFFLASASAREEPARGYLSMAQSELDRISRITRQTLAFNRESDQPVHFDAADAVNGVLTLYGREFIRRNIKTKFAIRETPSLGFPGELRQVVSNVIRNAIEAVEEGGGTVSVRLVRGRDPHEHRADGLLLRVGDTGPGIDAEVRKRVFDAFFTTKRLKGSGLGLWLSADLIANRGGSISFRTRAGRCHGTVFTVFLPDQS